MHLVHYPVLASRLAGSLVARVRDAGADVLLTSNTGCSLHLTDELEAAGLNLSVRHPVEFIAEQLGI
jgi:glycolate oxidase iron-sulfur subunit